MTIEKITENAQITLKPNGWLDTLSSPLLGEEIDKIDEAEKIVLDFDAVEYMSSAGLRQVVAANKKAKSIGAGFSVVNVGAEVMSIFKMTGIDKKLEIKAK